MKSLVLTCAVALALSTLGAVRSATPNFYNGNANGWQMKRHAEKMNVITNGGARVIFLGDSITHFWEDAKRGLEVFQGIQKKYDILDLGYSSDCTEHVLGRITEGRELDGYKAKLIVLMIGTNNTGYKREDEPPSHTVEGIREILRVIRQKQPRAKIVLLPIFPRGASVQDPRRLRNEEVNKAIRSFADGRTVFWVDFNAKMLDAKGDTLWCMPDRLHPNTMVYRDIWLPAIKPYLERYGK